MKSLLHIGPDFSLPLEAVTQTLVVYGGKGMGKTNFLAVFAEELARAGLRFSLLDPVGASWGLQHGKTGDDRGGLEVLILGGKHGDLPIEPTGGAVIADLVADESVSTIVDISRRADGKMWSHGEKLRFTAEYSTRLFERQGERCIPIMQIYDEAGRLCPQNIPHGAVDAAKCVGAIEQLVEVGRNVAVGVTLVTQRSARMNKSVSELADCMIAFRTVGPNSVDAVLDWFGEHVEKSRHKELIGHLRTLEVGRALVVSPGWLRFEGVAQVRERRTFDSSKTPAPGQRAAKPGAARKPDLAKYSERMADTIERAKQDDPKELRRKIAEMAREMGSLKTELEHAKASTKTETKKVEIRTVLEKDLAALQRTQDAMAPLLERLQSSAAMVAMAAQDSQLANAAAERLRRDEVVITKPGHLPGPRSSTVVQRTAAVQRPAPAAARGNGHSTEGVSAYAMSLIETMAQREPMRLTRRQISTLSGRSHRSSAFAPALREVLEQGLAAVDGNGQYELTDAGRALVPASRRTPKTGEQIQQQWLQSLPAYERALMEALIAEYPRAASRERLSELTGKSLTSSAFAPALSTLCKNGIATRLQDDFRANEDLFG